MIDKKLDMIEVMLLKLTEEDIFRESLEKEYKLYRDILEKLPRSANPPDKFLNSVLSLEQRLKMYILYGKISNPTVDPYPTLSRKIKDESEIQALLNEVNSNASYIESRKQSLEVLKSYLANIDYAGSLEDIQATIELVQNDYLKLDIYSNDLERELSGAKYSYTMLLILNRKSSIAEEYVKAFSNDMISLVYKKHNESVKKLLEGGKSYLAKVLNDFLLEPTEAKIQDIELWKVIAQIEDPTFNPQEDSNVSKSNDVLPIETKADVIVPKKKKFSLKRLLPFKNEVSFLKKDITTNNFTVHMEDTSINIEVQASLDFKFNSNSLEKLFSFLEQRYNGNEEAFCNVTLTIVESSALTLGTSFVKCRDIITKISKLAYLKKVHLKSSYRTHNTYEGEFCNCLFEEFKISSGSWKFDTETFSSCILLKRVDLSETNVYKLGKHLFYKCIALEEVILPPLCDSSLQDGVFSGCKELVKVKLPLYLDSIPKDTFKGCYKLQDFGILSSVETIYESAFEDCRSITSVSIPFSLKNIGERAFYGCTNLKRFTFNDDVGVGNYAFAYTGLEDVHINVAFRKFGHGVFQGSKIKTAYFSGELAVMQDTFKDCTELEKVTLKDDIYILADGCFSGCKKLRNLEGKQNYIHIGNQCFKDCVSLFQINISPKASFIGKQAFMNCKNLISIQFPNLDTIPEEVFKGCSLLEEVIFVNPDSICNVEQSAFEDCTRLIISIPKNVRRISKSAYKGTTIRTLDMSQNLSEIEEDSFSDCRLLEKVIFSSRIREIKQRTFSGCFSLKEVDMSNSYVSTIEDNAFNGCESIKSIKFSDAIREVSENAFNKSSEITEIEVPKIFYNFTRNNTLNSLGLQNYTIASIEEQPNERLLINVSLL